MLDLSALEAVMLPLIKKHKTYNVFKHLVQSLIYKATADKDEDYLLISAFQYLKERYPLDEEYFLFTPIQFCVKQLAYINKYSDDGNDILGEYYLNQIEDSGIIKTCAVVNNIDVPRDLLEFHFPKSTFILDTACSTGRLLLCFSKKFTGNYQVFYGIESNVLFAQISALNLMFNNIVGEILCVHKGTFIASYAVDLCPFGIFQYTSETKESSILWNLYLSVLNDDHKQQHHILFLKPQF